MEKEEISKWAAEAAKDPTNALNTMFIKSQELFINKDVEGAIILARMAADTAVNRLDPEHYCKYAGRCVRIMFLQQGKQPRHSGAFQLRGNARI